MTVCTSSVPALSLKDSSSVFTESFCRSLKETGFARIVDHGIDIQTLKNAYNTVQELFALPLEAKQACQLSDLGIRGYTGFGKEKAKGQSKGDLKEFWHVGKELSDQSPYSGVYPDNVWPKELPLMRQQFVDLFAELETMALQLLQHISVGLNIDADYFPALVDDGNSVLRLIHYPPVTGLNTADQMRAAPHADINLMTLLIGATDSGLELLDKHGDWQAVPTGSEEIVVDTGDMMALITGNTLPSTVHRVINPDKKVLNPDSGAIDQDSQQKKPVSKARYSMPFFLHPHSHAVLECLPQFCKPSTPNQTAITAGNFLQQRLRENGLIT